MIPELLEPVGALICQLNLDTRKLLSKSTKSRKYCWTKRFLRMWNAETLFCGNAGTLESCNFEMFNNFEIFNNFETLDET